MPRLQPDADTLFLFDFELENMVTGGTPGERVVTSSADAVAPISLVFTSAYTDTTIVSSSIGGVNRNLLYWGGTGTSTEAKRFAVSDTFLSACWGANTIECWAYLNSSYTNLFDFVLGPNGSGESIPTNFTMRYELGSDGRFDYFHETGSAGTNVTCNQSVGTYDTEVWQHIGLVRSQSGANTRVSFYKNGTLLETVQGVGGLPNTGSGVNIQDFTIGWPGALYSFRFSNIPRSGSEISASAARADWTHPVDANTVAHWTFEKEPLIANRGTSAGQFVKRSTLNYYKSMPLNRYATGSLYIDQNSSFIAGGEAFIADSAAHINKAESEWTCDWWMRRDPASSNTYYVVDWGGRTDGNETEEQNRLINIRMETNKTIRVFHESGSGQDTCLYTTTASFASNPNAFAPYYYAVVMKNHSNPQTEGKYIEFYQNGTLIETSSGSSFTGLASGGTNSVLRFGGNMAANTTQGFYQTFRILKRALTASEILDTYLSGVLTVVTGTEVNVPASPAVAEVNLFKAYSGSQLVYFRSDEAEPAGITNKTFIGTILEEV